MTKRIIVAACEDLVPGQAKAVQANGEHIALFNVEGAYHACSDVCPHAGAPLHQGFTSKDNEGNPFVTCPWHGWTFPLTPSARDRPDGVARYRVHIREGMIELEMDDARGQDQT